MERSIQQNIEAVLEKIEKSAVKAGKGLKDITLVGVTKTVSADKIVQAFNAGLADFGENRVQEYLAKREAVDNSARWHLIGQMQTNKVKYIVDGIFMLHSLDRLPLALEIERQCEKIRRPMNVLIEVNISGETSKGGIRPEALEPFVEQLAALKWVNVKGLMGIAPLGTDNETARPSFAELNRMYEKLKSFTGGNINMRHLSMGMSGDFEGAILEGSNMVRIGSAIFGVRST